MSLFIGAIAITDGRYGKGVGPVHMSNVRCDGHEMRLENCSHSKRVGPVHMSYVGCDGLEMRLENCSHSNGVGVTNCNHERDAGVLCKGI